ncbi:MAG: hypothetical protein V2I67_18950, partial [Thermoanaerobaculales bacterium]|nr:hypothetical protein [Thermoanaerobaculales bacterium]
MGIDDDGRETTIVIPPFGEHVSGTLGVTAVTTRPSPSEGANMSGYLPTTGALATAFVLIFSMVAAPVAGA